MGEIPAAIELNDVSATYAERGRRLPVLDRVSLTAAPGEFVAIVGPSGSGKSTLLDVIAGLIEPDSGTVGIAGHVLSARERLGKSAYLRQRDLLMPWRTVQANAAVALEAHGMPRRQARTLALDRLREFELDGFAHAYPAQLSGGMRQRVAFVRTMLAESPILLLDEPFSALDALTRSDLHRWVQDVLPRGQRTVLLVTHDVEEALLLADRVLVVSPRPARVVAEEPVRFPRPRRRSLTLAPEFLAEKARLLIHLGTAAPA
jgi:ABC-type nitrate/sulfonate/bicarbonate transport system ATPase subunit